VLLKAIALRTASRGPLSAEMDGVHLGCSHTQEGERLLITFKEAIDLSAGKKLTMRSHEAT